MSVGNIKHKFSIAIESDNPVSRAIGILKVAQAFEKEGIHLASDLNTATSRQLAAASDADEVVNDTIVATMVESIPEVGQALPTREMGGLYPVPYPALRKLSAEEEIRGANFLEQTLGNAKEAFKSFDERYASSKKSIIHRRPAFISESIEVEVEHQDKFITSGYNPNCVMILFDYVRLNQSQYQATDGVSIKIVDKDIVKKLARGSKIEAAHIPASDVSDGINEDLSSLGDALADMLLDRLGLPAADTGYPAMDRLSRFRQGEQAPGPGFAIASDKPGNIPGYEHNPMAQAEYFKANKPDTAPIFLRPAERPVSNNWPEPMPVGLTKTTLVVATDEFGDNEPNYDYTVVGFSPRLERETTTGWHEMKKISLLSNVDGEEGPNNVRVEDLLAICADHLNSLQLAGKASYSHVDAHKSIIKALHHLHGLTVLQHVKPTDQSDK
jgi:hypothetical protein